MYPLKVNSRLRVSLTNFPEFSPACIKQHHNENGVNSSRFISWQHTVILACIQYGRNQPVLLWNRRDMGLAYVFIDVFAAYPAFLLSVNVNSADLDVPQSSERTRAESEYGWRYGHNAQTLHVWLYEYAAPLASYLIVVSPTGSTPTWSLNEGHDQSRF